MAAVQDSDTVVSPADARGRTSLAWLVLLYERSRQRGLVIAAAVASFQLALLLFLTFA